ncbi:AraC family transcriptional regulator [Chryseobacterium taiwanense]|uniref:AraC family transcriptional regulator n=1 Tax=Chryseobacterium taiwanense TaxID=363331 RepID=A0A0B4D275_9FLAO|nr:AraC family transcriptional regulator [Chryseobacterium taiwanense]KIC62722.1 AraC family transcriptional regulator [Chryseobacterium taiwanense]
MNTNPDIQRLNDIPTQLPISLDYYETWNIRVVNRNQIPCNNYLSPNRRDFYKILFISSGSGIFTHGMNSYEINEPTILFLHPNEIISWQNFTPNNDGAGHYCLFKKRYIEQHPALKAAVDKYEIFNNPNKSIIKLDQSSTKTVNNLFDQMHTQIKEKEAYAEDTLQVFLQFIIIESIKNATFPEANTVTDDFGHIHHFFGLLEEELSDVNFSNPLRMRTAKEFADSLHLHPNYLNSLLKKHTGVNISTHIKNRLLEECKALLLQTHWSLQQVAYAVGYAEQPNFSAFFKKNVGITPGEFRKSYMTA